MEQQTRDWEKIVSESNGDLFFLPKEFEGEAKEWFEMREEYNNVVKKMAEKELTMNMKLNNLIFNVRKQLSENGHPDIWLKDVGFETGALREGKYVMSLYEAGKNQIPRA